jgi:hypothetical protein
MTAQLLHYLLVFDHDKDQLVHEEQFEDSDTAVQAYFEMEESHRNTPMIEIVLIGSDSLETVKLTHANYFNGTVGVSKYLVDLLQ